MFNDMKMGTKLLGSFMVIVAILIVVAVIGYINIKSIAKRAEAMYSQNTAAIEDLGSISARLEKMRGDLYRYIDVPAERQKMAQAQNEAVNSVNETMKIYKGRDIGDEEKKVITEFEAAWPEMQRGYKAIRDAADEGKNDEVNRLLDTGSYVVAARSKTFAAVNALNEINRKNAQTASKVNSEASSRASAAMIFATVLAVVIAIAMGVLLTTSITGPLKRGVWMMEELESGHVSSRLGIKRKDEIGILT